MIMSTPTSAREALAAALARKSSLEADVASARKAVDGARTFIAGLDAKARTFADLDAKVAAERARLMKAAVAEGKAPKFDVSPELAAAVAEKIEIDNQLAAARAALEELEREAVGAEQRLAASAEEVGRNVEAVVLEVSAGLAASIDTIEARALEMRVALEGVSEHWRMDGGKMVPIKTDDSVRRILETNALTPIGTLNTQLNRRAKASRGRWEEFITALGGDARAEF